MNTQATDPVRKVFLYMTIDPSCCHWQWETRVHRQGRPGVAKHKDVQVGSDARLLLDTLKGGKGT